MQSRYIEPRELAALRSACTPRTWLPLQIAAETGLRIGDVLKLRWDDISGQNLRFVAQKTGKAGVAVIGAETARFLRLWRRGAPSPWVFPSPKRPDLHLTRQTIWKRVKTACARAGLNPQGVSPHSFRKYYGVQEYHRHGIGAARAGLQHTDIATTEIYALADWATGERAAEPLRRSDLPRIIRYIAAWLNIAVDRGFSAEKPSKVAEKQKKP